MNSVYWIVSWTQCSIRSWLCNYQNPNVMHQCLLRCRKEQQDCQEFANKFIDGLVEDAPKSRARIYF